jgi:hypothetical protein
MLWCSHGGTAEDAVMLCWGWLVQRIMVHWPSRAISPKSSFRLPAVEGEGTNILTMLGNTHPVTQCGTLDLWNTQMCRCLCVRCLFNHPVCLCYRKWMSGFIAWQKHILIKIAWFQYIYMCVCELISSDKSITWICWKSVTSNHVLHPTTEKIKRFMFLYPERCNNNLRKMAKQKKICWWKRVHKFHWHWVVSV